MALASGDVGVNEDEGGEMAPSLYCLSLITTGDDCMRKDGSSLGRGRRKLPAGLSARNWRACGRIFIGRFSLSI